MKVPPPKDIPPERLFRLLTNPRPVVAISHRVPGAENVKLSVRSLSAREWSESFDVDSEIELVRNGRSCAEVISRALLADNNLAFRTADQVQELPEDSLLPLYAAVIDALDRMGPPRWRRDEGSWLKKVREGAMHVSNATDLFAIGTSYDVGGSTILDRPERYYGISVRDLTDGHWLAYRVCRDVLLERMK